MAFKRTRASSRNRRLLRKSNKTKVYNRKIRLRDSSGRFAPAMRYGEPKRGRGRRKRTRLWGKTGTRIVGQGTKHLTFKLRARISNFKSPPVKPTNIRPNTVNINNNSFNQTNNNSFKKVTTVNNTTNNTFRTKVRIPVTVGITFGAASAAALYKRNQDKRR